MNLKSIFKGIQNIAGVDEVGRGSLIGPVYASAVILKKNCDVKKLKEHKFTFDNVGRGINNNVN